MSDLTETEIEQSRTAMVQICVQQLIQEIGLENVTHVRVAKRLPPDFYYDSVKDSWERFKPTIDQPKGEDPVQDTETSLHTVAHEIEMETYSARQNVEASIAARKIMRSALANALQVWNSGGRKTLTPAELSAEFCKQSILERQAQKDRGKPTSFPSGGNSKWAVDHSRARWNSTPEGHVASRMQVGNKRTFPDQNGNRTSVALARRANAERVFAKKLPSEQ